MQLKKKKEQEIKLDENHSTYRTMRLDILHKYGQKKCSCHIIQLEATDLSCPSTNSVNCNIRVCFLVKENGGNAKGYHAIF